MSVLMCGTLNITKFLARTEDFETLSYAIWWVANNTIKVSTCTVIDSGRWYPQRSICEVGDESPQVVACKAILDEIASDVPLTYLAFSRTTSCSSNAATIDIASTHHRAKVRCSKRKATSPL